MFYKGKVFRVFVEGMWGECEGFMCECAVLCEYIAGVTADDEDGFDLR